MKKIRIAINGFGRIGRAAFKIALSKPQVEVVAINDLSEASLLAYLLRHDTVYGAYDKEVKASKSAIIINKKKYPVFAVKDPALLPWKKLKVDVVLECTGVFDTREGSSNHIKAGAKQVIISAPSDSEDVKTYVFGGNAEAFKKEKGSEVISMGSCTTNCIVPVMKIMEETFGVKKAFLNTSHAYTATQVLVDSPAKKPDRSRAGAANQVPSTTGAARAAHKVLPKLKGVFDGIAVRVPVICGSLSDLTIQLKKKVTEKQLAQAFKRASQKPYYKGILAVAEEPLVSSDIIGTIHSAIVQPDFIRVVGGDLVKVLAWYDNEWAYSNRLIEMAVFIGKKL